MGTMTRFETMVLVAGALLFGCASDKAEDVGAAPTIKDLTLAPLEVEVGKAGAISGSVTFEDADGDVVEIGVDVTLPDGTNQSLPKIATQGATGTKQGTLAVALAFGPPVVGAYKLSVFAVDGKGHESNRLGATVTAK